MESSCLRAGKESFGPCQKEQRPRILSCIAIFLLFRDTDTLKWIFIPEEIGRYGEQSPGIDTPYLSCVASGNRDLLSTGCSGSQDNQASIAVILISPVSQQTECVHHADLGSGRCARRQNPGNLVCRHSEEMLSHIKGKDPQRRI
jgi:hypothetical protein